MTTNHSSHLPGTENPSWLLLIPWELHHPGGVNQALLNLCHQIALHGEYIPRVLIRDWNHHRLCESEEGGRLTARLRLAIPWNATRSFKNLVKFLTLLPRTVWQLFLFIRQRRVQVINIYWPDLAILPLAALRGLGLFTGKFVLTFQGGDIRLAAATSGVERILWHFLLWSADLIVACSDDLRQEVVSFGPSVQHKTMTIHNGVDIAVLEQERQIGGAIDDRLRTHPFILNVATFEAKKGQDTLVRAFARIAQKFPDVLLVLIGRDGDTKSALVELIAQLQLQTRVVIYQDVLHENVIPFFPAATVFVLSSRIEPFGIVILEAGAFGVPVVATRVGGVPEILEDGVTGCLVPADDVETMATAIISLLENPERQQQLGARLRHHVLANFTWERTFTKYLEQLCR